jgi:hypothetical protein
MSYRIAHVRFTTGGQTYPVNCNRADLAPGDLVIVEMLGNDLDLKAAEVDRIEFLNWRCKHTIKCKRSELRPDGSRGIRVEREIKPQAVETPEELEEELQRTGWHATCLSLHVYRRVLVKRFESHSAAIGMRRNGIDFQIYDEEWCGDLSKMPRRFPDGTRNLVRHQFYASELDLFEFCKKFASNAHLPFDQLATYFQPLGRKQPRPPRERDNLADIRSVLGDAMTDAEREAFR